MILSIISAVVAYFTNIVIACFLVTTIIAVLAVWEESENFKVEVEYCRLEDKPE